MKFQVLQQLLLERSHATPLVVQRCDVIQRPLQPHPVDWFGQKVGRAAADRLQRGIQRVISGHQNGVHPGIAPRGTVQELVSVHPRHVHVHQYQPALAILHQLQGLLRVGRGDSFLSQIRNHRRQHFQLRRIVIQNAGGQR
jgi:hypothetical protein